MTLGRARVRAAQEPLVQQLRERLPNAGIGRIEALVALLNQPPFNGRADLPALAEEANLTDDQLLPVTHALALLDLATMSGGDIALTPVGQRYVNEEPPLRQRTFGEQLLARVPLAAHIRHSLAQEPSGALPEELFLKLLREGMSDEDAERVMKVVIEWGRYAEVFDYNYRSGQIQLPDEADAAA